MNEPLLNVKNLSVSFQTEEKLVTPVQNISFTLNSNETLAIVGESGSGKSVTSFALMGLLPPEGRISQGEILYKNRNKKTVALHEAGGSNFKGLRGKEIAMIFQEPMTSLNPLMTIGEQIAEVTRLHLGFNRKEAHNHAIKMLDKVEINNAALRVNDYPHHLSGGMRQRVMIAIALACNPSLLIADEPTTALDVTVQAQILKLIDNLKQEMGMSVLFITHNLGVVAEIANRVMVFYSGEIVEQAKVNDIFTAPQHPYTQALLACLPSRALKSSGNKRTIQSIRGQVGQMEKGCNFAPRCDFKQKICFDEKPIFNKSVSCHFAGKLS